MRILITCTFWLSSMLTSEIKHLGYKTFDTFDTWTYIEWDREDIYNLNLWTRIWNKVFLELWEKKNINTFDLLFDFVKKIWWDDLLLTKNISISVSVDDDSLLTSTKTIQSICHKAILTKLVEKNISYRSQNKQFIFIYIRDNTAKVFLNTSWESLHNRWYRKKTWEAPLKENIAASLVLLYWRRFNDLLLDPMCWSWTILIEAGMIARNIAPWLNRKFAFQDFCQYDKNLLDGLKTQAKTKIFQKKYNIIWYDIDERVLDFAKQNAKNAWVLDTIKFEKKDFLDIDIPNWATVITNPPYWKRLKITNIDDIYKKLINIFNFGVKWWFFTSYLIKNKIDRKKRNPKNINNNHEDCIFRRKRD